MSNGVFRVVVDGLYNLLQITIAGVRTEAL